MSGKASSDAGAKAVSSRDGDGRTPRVAPEAIDSAGKNDAGAETARGKMGGAGGGNGNGGKGGSCHAEGDKNRGIKRVLSSSSSSSHPSPEADASSSDALRKAGTAERDGELEAKDEGNKNNNEEENNKDESEEGEGGGEGSDDWYTAGSQYLRRRVGRIVNEEGGKRSFAAGTVVGWLPIEVADFVSEYTNEAAALWHIKFDREEVGEEDLEEFEVVEAIKMWEDRDEIMKTGCKKRDRDGHVADDDDYGARRSRSSKKRGRGGGEGLAVAGGAPTRPPSAFVLWRSDNIDDLRKKQPPEVELSKFCGEQWQKVSDDVKKAYKGKYEDLYKKYENEVKAFEEEGGVVGGGGKGRRKGKEGEKEGGRSRDGSDVTPASKKRSKSGSTSREGGGEKERGGGGHRDDGNGQKSSKGEGDAGESGKKKRARLVDVEPWFCLRVDEAGATDELFALLEVSTSVLPDGRCRAREWYSCAEVCAVGKQTAGEQRFALVYSHQKNHTLPSRGWVQVDVRHGIYKGRSYIQVVDEEAMAEKAFKILRGEEEQKPMPSEAELITCGKKKKRQAVTQAVEEDVDEDEDEDEEEDEERIDSEKKAMADLVPKYLRRWEDDEVKPTLEERRVALISCRARLFEMIKKVGCGPILMRLAWQDACSYRHDSSSEWPKCGGCNGSVRLYPEIDHATNAKLEAAVSLLQPLHGERKGWVSWSDLIQMAGAVAVEVGGGERVPMRYGRLQVNERRHCAGEGATGRDMVIGCRFGRGDGGVEGLVAGDGDATVPGPHAGHLRKVFSRMGLGDGAAVALLGNPSIRRSFAEKESSDSLAGTRWRGDASPFDNVFFEHVFGTLAEQRPRRGEVEALLEDAGLRSVAEGFAGDRGLFYKEYARAHAAMAECGACFEPREGILLDDGSEGRGRGVQDGGGVEAMQVD